MEFPQANNWEAAAGPMRTGNRQSLILRKRPAKSTPNWSISGVWFHSGCKAPVVIWPQIHAQGGDFVEISDPNARRYFDLRGDAAYSRVWQQKSGYAAGARRFGCGGRAGRAPRESAATPRDVDQSDSAPCVRHICAIWRRGSCLASRNKLSMWDVFDFPFPA